MPTRSSIHNSVSSNTPAQSISSGLRVTWIGMAVNLALVIFKLWAGFTARSQALIADGIHSVSDLFTDLVVIFGLRWGRRVEDEDHPFGHARIETISSMIVGALLVLVGCGIAYGAVTSIYLHESGTPSILAVYVAVISIISKEVLFWYTLAIGKRLRSLALIGNAWHHRSDALSSVVVLIGVSAPLIDPDWYMADAYAALLVTIFVVRVGGKLIWSALKELSDTAPEKDVLLQLAGIARQVDGVRQVHDMRARTSGSQILVELHIVVDPELTVRQGHDIAREVKRRLLVEIPDVRHVIIHVDPELKPED